MINWEEMKKDQEEYAKMSVEGIKDFINELETSGKYDYRTILFQVIGYAEGTHKGYESIMKSYFED